MPTVAAPTMTGLTKALTARVCMPASTAVPNASVALRSHSMAPAQVPPLVADGACKTLNNELPAR